MTGLDTNVLVRFIMQDDRKQSLVATRYIDSLSAASPAFVSLVALVELAWVLESVYALDRAQRVAAMSALLHAREIVVDQAAIVWKAIRAHEADGADFADALIERLGIAAGCERTVTFDRSAAKHAGMALLS